MSVKEKRMFWPALTLVTFSAFAIILGAARIGHSAPTKEASATQPLIASIKATPNAAIAGASDDDKAFWLTVRPLGFEVKEMTLAAGDYFVIVQNATGLNEFGLRVEREPGQRVYEVQLPSTKKKWRQMVHLAPGRYRISETSHPDWTCEITVTDR